MKKFALAAAFAVGFVLPAMADTIPPLIANNWTVPNMTAKMIIYSKGRIKVLEFSNYTKCQMAAGALSTEVSKVFVRSEVPVAVCVDP